jgi:hypothetical protein
MSLLLAAALALGSTPPTGEALVGQMHARYAGKWYRTLTFVQTTTFPDGRLETWYEALTLPGRLRIDIAPVPERNTILFSGDSIYQWQRATQRAAAPFIHPLLVLGFDVYHQAPARTIQQLQGLGFDLTKVHSTEWQGRPVWVVGADSGDTRAPQFWIDQERLVFVRSLQPARQDPSVINEVQFNKYERLGRGWIAPEVLIFRNGALVMKEEYGDVRIDVTLPPSLWDAGNQQVATWMN